MRSRVQLIVAAFTGLGSIAVLGVPGSEAGPVALIDQDRSVRVTIPSIVESEPNVDETLTAPDHAPFNVTLDRTLSQLEQTNHAFASQDSSYGNVGDVFSVVAQGESQYSATGVPGIVFAESDFSLQFQLDEPRDYTINGTGSFVDTGSGASNFAVTLTGPGGTVASFTKADFDPGNLDGAVVNPVFDTGGTLDAGLYTLFATSGVSGGTNLSGIESSFGFTFIATADPVIIPLPAAAGPGALALGILGLASARRFVRRG